MADNYVFLVSREWFDSYGRLRRYTMQVYDTYEAVERYLIKRSELNPAWIRTGKDEWKKEVNEIEYDNLGNEFFCRYMRRSIGKRKVKS